MDKNIKVEIINQLSDNYCYVIYCVETKKAIIIDPAESNSVIDFLSQNKISLKGILITHHHSDHTQGIKGILKYNQSKVYSPNKNIIETTDIIKNNDELNFEFINFKIIETPGHTLDHIIFYSAEQQILFSGDALFCYGCGRVFEGTMQQMLDSINKIKILPKETQIYCGHEYTYKNLEFVFEELFESSEKEKMKEECLNRIKEYGSSMPFTLKHQIDWNPFLKCDDTNYKETIANYSKNKGKISIDTNELDFFTYIRKKRNTF